MIWLIACSAPRPAPAIEPGMYAKDTLLESIVKVPLSTDGVADVDGITETGKFIKYLVRCALSSDQTVTVGAGDDAEEYAGDYGLTPEWASGPCDEACQEKVSSCLLASTNLYGLTVYVSFFGPHIPAAVLDNEAAYRDGAPIVQEAAFFGNYFTNPPLVYACTGTGVDPFQRAFRACSHAGSPCGIEVVGTCWDVDGTTALPSAHRACEELDTEDGYYRKCHAGVDDAGQFPGRTWDWPITTQIWKSDLMPGEETCFDGQ